MKVTNVYNLKDYVNVNDDQSSIRGYVVMTDENGKTLFAKNNMIVKKGREIIQKCVAKSVFGKGEGNTLTFSTLKFGDKNDVTKSDNDKLHGNECLKDNKNIKIDISTGDRCIILKTTIALTDDDNDTIISEAGLFCKDTDNNKDIMFSRVAFAPLTITTKTTYTLNYYIYF